MSNSKLWIFKVTSDIMQGEVGGKESDMTTAATYFKVLFQN
jgi:hypothetical protein